MAVRRFALVVWIALGLSSITAPPAEIRRPNRILAPPMNSFTKTLPNFATTKTATMITIEPVAFDQSPPLRDAASLMPAVQRIQRGGQDETDPAQRPTSKLDPALQTVNRPNLMPPTTVFAGQSAADLTSVIGFAYVPPDPTGAIGINHYVQWVNTILSVYQRDGTRVYGPVTGNTLWNGFNNQCATTNNGDPIVLYDRIADRWLMSQFSFRFSGGQPVAPFYQCIAVSQTGDPTGSYYRYAYEFAKFPDYGKFGIWHDGYYMALNLYDGDTPSGVGIAAFDRAAMLTGDSNARMIFSDMFSVDPTLSTMLPSDWNGFIPPPRNAPNYFVQFNDDAWRYPSDQLEMWAFHVDWNTVSNSTFSNVGVLNTAPFDSNLCNYGLCINQPSTTQKLDAIADRLMYRLQYRNFGDYQSLVLNHSVDANGADQAGIRWYELRCSHSCANIADWQIQQQSTFAPDADSRWMGSIGMDRMGNIALGYSVSSNTTFPSIRYAGRLANDPPNQLAQGEGEIVAGGGSQTVSFGRWGDYSTMTLDPLDDCTFWYTNEYMPTTSSNGWTTKIASFKFPSCTTLALNYVYLPTLQR